MTPAERASRYRAQASEIRAAAELAVSSGARLMLLEIADGYEHLASLIDAPIGRASILDRRLRRD
jgi:hypothetical protein